MTIHTCARVTECWIAFAFVPDVEAWRVCKPICANDNSIENWYFP